MEQTPPSTETVGAGAGRPAPTTTSRPSSSQESSRPPSVDFDPERCGAYFKECAAYLHDIPIEPFLSACEEIKKLIGGWRVLTPRLPDSGVVDRRPIFPV
jgi:hypothetical protein